MRAVLFGLLIAGAAGELISAQTPQPIPRPGGRAQQPPPVTAPAQAPAPRTAAPAVAAPAAPAQGAAEQQSGAPSAASLGLPVYPTAQFIASYDAGRGQRYYMFGTAAAYAEVVAFYRSQLRDKGDSIFDMPPTHMFQIGKFRDETMAFPPSVTVKDWTWGGSQGYPNPKLGAQPTRFPSIIMIVPAPPAAAPASR